jgi:hypothetical protein
VFQNKEDRQMSMNNQKTWIVVAGLAAVIAGVAFLSNDFPSGSEQASGTIVPAERYPGDQISYKHVNLGDESGALLMQTDVFELGTSRWYLRTSTS